MRVQPALDDGDVAQLARQSAALELDGRSGGSSCGRAARDRRCRPAWRRSRPACAEMAEAAAAGYASAPAGSSAAGGGSRRRGGGSGRHQHPASRGESVDRLVTERVHLPPAQRDSPHGTVEAFVRGLGIEKERPETLVREHSGRLSESRASAKARWARAGASGRPPVAARSASATFCLRATTRRAHEMASVESARGPEGAAKAGAAKIAASTTMARSRIGASRASAACGVGQRVVAGP